MRKVSMLALTMAAGLAGCQSSELTEDPVLREQVAYADAASVPVIGSSAETTPVESQDDAADDPAIWVHPTDPSRSLVLGTDKQSGIGVYGLDGTLRSFLAIGRPNNVDLRQGVALEDGTWDIAAATNRADDSVTLMRVADDGLTEIGRFPATLPEPYGLCVGKSAGQLVVFVTYKTGEVVAHRVSGTIDKPVATMLGQLRFSSQLEGCDYDEARSTLVVGEEAYGVWRTRLTFTPTLAWSDLALIDRVGAESGIAADVEGVAIYRDAAATILVVSSQGNDSYALYNLADNRFLARFRVGASGGRDGTQETDGIAVTARSLGAGFPSGVLVVQDGFNAPSGTPQNFKIIDWREVGKLVSQ